MNDAATNGTAWSSPDLGIVLIAHGSRRPAANDDLRRLADQLQHANGPRYVASFLELADPDIVTAGLQCAALGVRRVVLSPYFLSAGRHVVDDLEAARRELTEKRPDVEFRLAGPLGPHPLLRTILLQRVAEALDPANGHSAPP